MEEEIISLLRQTKQIQELLFQLNDVWNDEHGKKFMQKGLDSVEAIEKELKAIPHDLGVRH